MPILGDLGRQLVQRWAALLALPGLLLAAAAMAGTALGQRHPFDRGRLADRADQAARSFADRPPSVQLLLVAALLLAVAAAGVVVEAAAGVTLTGWLGPWPRVLSGPGRWLTDRRETHWLAAQQRVSALESAYPAPRAAAERREIDEAAAAREAIAPARPARPTWMGDRVAGADIRVLNQYGLDLAAVWPRLWLILPDEVRTEVAAARTRIEEAARLATWAVPFVLVAVVWWPAAVIAAVPALSGWRRGRAAAATYGLLLESTVDVHAGALATRLGEDPGLQLETGRALTRRLKKGS
ncbi:hypothetical protein ACFVTC_33900 [Streptomyces sp. NPDC057950]|uniref:hypothetical protein n=1 Tax=Streptomyces sp. NPDC057950 TaxID=3346288 RepID=UPI0036E8F718